MNITTEQRLHIFMLYPNAKVKARDEYIWIDEGRISKFIINFHGEGVLEVYPIDGTKPEYYEPQECQLILKDLNQITEEDKRELTVVLGWNSKQDTTIKYLVSETYSSPYFQVDTGWTYEKFFIDRLPHTAADHLRKKRYMVPVYIEGQMIDLFEAGIAVRETTPALPKP
jgi:hypothetical protein